MTGGPPFQELPPPPDRVTAGAVLSRLAQGVGFRYRWATEGLVERDLAFRPVDGSMNLGELLAHIHGLVRWVAISVGLDPAPAGSEPPAGLALRGATLDVVRALTGRLEVMTEADLQAVRVRTSRGELLPFWNLVNGPLADSLTHIGQISSWRRILGNPVAGADVFRGRPPARPAAQ